MKRNTYLFPLGLLLLAVATLASCGGKASDTLTQPHTANYLVDSARLFGRADALFDRQEYTASIPLLDSVFRLPLATPTTPDGLSEAETTYFCRRALRDLMVTYNILHTVDEGYQHLDRIEQLHHPMVEQHCRMALWGAKAQMLMPLGRHKEALDYLNRASTVTDEADSPDYEIYWTAAAGITYMGVDSVATDAERSLLRSVDIVRRRSNIDKDL